MPPRPLRSGIGSAGGRPELPAFCRTRERQPITVGVSRLRTLERLMGFVLLFQLITLLLVLHLLPAPDSLPPSASTPYALQQEQLQP